MAANQFSINPTQGYKEWDDWGHITPNVEFSEGYRPAGEFQIAPYLPLVRYDAYNREFKVLSQGKVVGFDVSGYVVPAGLRLQAAAYKVAADAGANIGAGLALGDALTTIDKYTAVDVQNGVKNAAGAAVTVGEPVVKSFFNITALPLVQLNTISSAIGITYMDCWPHPGGDGINPATFNRSNYNLQSRIGFLRYYQIELPLVQDTATYKAAPFPGIAACVAAAGTVKPGMFVSYDLNSNFVVSGYDYGPFSEEDVLGQVTSVRGSGPFQLLDRVRTAQNGVSVLEAMPGTATVGKSDTITYSGGYGLVRICLNR